MVVDEWEVTSGNRMMVGEIETQASAHADDQSRI